MSRHDPATRLAEEGISVRAGRGEDLSAIVALERRSKGAPHWGEAVYRKTLEQGGIGIGAEKGLGRLLLVAEAGEELAGFAVASAMGEPDLLNVELESVLVAEELRRRGVGWLLCSAVMGWAGELGAAAVDLEVRTSSGARELYRKLGFLEVGCRRGYYRDPDEDALLMRLELG